MHFYVVLHISPVASDQSDIRTTKCHISKWFMDQTETVALCCPFLSHFSHWQWTSTTNKLKRIRRNRTRRIVKRRKGQFLCFSVHFPSSNSLFVVFYTTIISWTLSPVHPATLPFSFVAQTSSLVKKRKILTLSIPDENTGSLNSVIVSLNYQTIKPPAGGRWTIDETLSRSEIISTFLPFHKFASFSLFHFSF